LKKIGILAAIALSIALQCRHSSDRCRIMPKRFEQLERCFELQMCIGTAQEAPGKHVLATGKAKKTMSSTWRLDDANQNLSKASEKVTLTIKHSPDFN